MRVLFSVPLLFEQLITLFNYLRLGWNEKAKGDIKELGMKNVD
jgi:hypothetical protein